MWVKLSECDDWNFESDYLHHCEEKCYYIYACKEWICLTSTSFLQPTAPPPPPPPPPKKPIPNLEYSAKNSQGKKSSAPFPFKNLTKTKSQSEQNENRIMKLMMPQVRYPRSVQCSHVHQVLIWLWSRSVRKLGSCWATQYGEWLTQRSTPTNGQPHT